ADVVTGVELRAALADEDLARVDELAAEALDAEALGVGVAAVPGGAGTLLRCHGEACFRVVRTGARGPGLLDAGDLDPGQLLAVTLADAVARLVLVLLDRDLLALLGTHDLGGDGDLGQVVRTGGHLVAVHEHERGEGDGRPHLACNLWLDVVAAARHLLLPDGLCAERLVHGADVADGHLLLSAAGLDDRVHHVAAHLCRYGPRAVTGGAGSRKACKEGTSSTHRRSRVRGAGPPSKCPGCRRAPDGVCFRAHRPPHSLIDRSKNVCSRCGRGRSATDGSGRWTGGAAGTPSAQGGEGVGDRLVAADQLDDLPGGLRPVQHRDDDGGDVLARDRSPAGAGRPPYPTGARVVGQPARTQHRPVEVTPHEVVVGGLLGVEVGVEDLVALAGAAGVGAHRGDHDVAPYPGPLGGVG